MKYTFTGPKGCPPTTVIAPDETEARHLAMTARWGKFRPGDPVMSPMATKYQGLGLDLIKINVD